jgi:hypothetical protein
MPAYHAPFRVSEKSGAMPYSRSSTSFASSLSASVNGSDWSTDRRNAMIRTQAQRSSITARTPDDAAARTAET